jgi:hypothetical protein
MLPRPFHLRVPQLRKVTQGTLHPHISSPPNPSAYSN